MIQTSRKIKMASKEIKYKFYWLQTVCLNNSKCRRVAHLSDICHYYLPHQHPDWKNRNKQSFTCILRVFVNFEFRLQELLLKCLPKDLSLSWTSYTWWWSRGLVPACPAWPWALSSTKGMVGDGPHIQALTSAMASRRPRMLPLRVNPHRLEINAL